MTPEGQAPDSWETRASLLRRVGNVADQQAWAEFDRVYRRLILAVARRRGLNDAEAEDIAQETLRTLVRVMPRFEYAPERCRFRGWLRQQADRRITDYLRRQPQDVVSPVTTDDTRRTATVERVPDPASLEPDRLWEEEWRRSVIHLALDKLRRSVRPLHYQAFYLHAIKGRTSWQVARDLGMGVARVYLLKHRVGHKFKRLAALARRELDQDENAAP
jgi:RNA polymerase sigma-70 factor (ECF subfamily)